MAFELLYQPIETIDRAALEAFERGYAERSNMQVSALHRGGMFGAPCECGEDGCTGWRMGNQHDEALFMEERRRRGDPEWRYP